jgi:hypothetical protein
MMQKAEIRESVSILSLTARISERRRPEVLERHCEG